MPHSSLTLSALLSRRDWENPQLTQWHRLPAHAPFNSWREASAARLDSASASRLSLNGSWRFNFFSAPEAVSTASSCGTFFSSAIDKLPGLGSDTNLLAVAVLKTDAGRLAGLRVSQADLGNLQAHT